MSVRCGDSPQEPAQAHVRGVESEEEPTSSQRQPTTTISRQTSISYGSTRASTTKPLWRQRLRAFSDSSGNHGKAVDPRRMEQCSVKEVRMRVNVTTRRSLGWRLSIFMYRTATELHERKAFANTTIVMIAETISLGILSLPYAVSRLGLIPGGVLTVLMGILTTYTGYVIYQFKMRYPWLRSFPDAANMIGGPIARWIVEVMMTCFLVFLMASHLVIFAKEANTIAGDGWQCTVVFTVLGMFVCMAATMPRALKASRWCSILSCISILAATFTSLTGVALKTHGNVTHHTITPLIPGTSSWPEAGLAVSSIIVSYTGHIAYFNIIGEMQTPKHFPKALLTTNAVTIKMYTLAGVAIYYFAGQGVPSPALSAASPVVQKIAYGLATPTIIVAGVIAAIVACKRVYDVVWRNQPHFINEDSVRAKGSWVAIVVSAWLIAFIIANVIPFFGALLGLIGAAVGTWICLGFPSIFWLYMNRKTTEPATEKRTRRFKIGKIALAVGFILVLIMCIGASGFGLWGAVDDIRRNSVSQPPFSCKSNVGVAG